MACTRRKSKPAERRGRKGTGLPPPRQVETAADLPKRSRSIRVQALSLAVLLFIVIALPSARDGRAQAAGFATPSGIAPATAPSASGLNIADEALKDLGTWQGQCFTWVKDVVERATGRVMGWGYRDGYLQAGAAEVPLSEAVRGDIIQLVNDDYADAGFTYPGLHTAIVLENLGGGIVDAIDSNQNWDEIVRLRPGYDPMDAASRYIGISVHVYRFPGGSAVDAPPPEPTTLSAGDLAVVDAGGDCLRIRSAPGLSGTRLDCLPDGSTVQVTGSAVVADGLEWLPVDTELGSGWMAAIYLAPIASSGGATAGTQLSAPAAADLSGDTTTVPTSVAVEGEPNVLVIPPAGGLTRGVAGTNDPAAIAEAQPFPVQTLFVFDVASQQYLTFIPGAPALVNTLSTDTLAPDDVVTIRRATTGAATPVAPTAIEPTGATALPAPPAGGLTLGVAGTSDVQTLLAAQSFPVQTLLAWDVETQGYLTFIPGAPAIVNTLNSSNLTPDTVVIIRRKDSGSVTVTTDQRTASITYYYCQQGTNPAGIGDGGGFCGGMASGQIVYEGAAACAPGYLGEQFTIQGDPTGRTYTCADTGSAVAGEHRDIFFYNSDDGYAWWLQVGATATIEIVN